MCCIGRRVLDQMLWLRVVHWIGLYEKGHGDAAIAGGAAAGAMSGTEYCDADAAVRMRTVFLYLQPLSLLLLWFHRAH